MKEKNNDYIMMILIVFIILFFLGGFIYVQNLKGTSTDKSKKEEKHTELALKSKRRGIFAEKFF